MKSMMGKYLPILNDAGTALQSPFLLLVRLYWGWQFIETGWGKVNHLDKVTEFFTSLGIPFAALQAPFVAGLELVGGMLLLVGLVSRPIALLLAINMLVAYIAADREALLAIVSNPEQFYHAAPYTFLFATMLIFIFGPGKASIDAWISGKKPEPTVLQQ